MSVRCGNCPEYHKDADEVKACYASKAAGDPSYGEGAWAKEPASEAQLKYIDSLVSERVIDGIDGMLAETLLDVGGGKQVGKAEASALITALKAAPRKSSMLVAGADVAPRNQPTDDDVPEGRYALDRNGTITFWQVDKPVEGRWSGYVFVNQIIGAPGDWKRIKHPPNKRAEVLAEIGEDVSGAAAFFGMKTRSCGQCGSPLSQVRSRAAGYGEKCADNNGWYYPTEAEARRILQELGEPVDEEQPEQPVAWTTAKQRRRQYLSECE